MTDTAGGHARGEATGAPPWTVVEATPPADHRATVIWLHGLGADGHDFLPIVPALGLDPSLGVRFLFPEAPFRPVTLNGGVTMRAWFDITSLDREDAINRTQLDEAVAGVRALAAAERERGIPPERLVLAGFSQGGAVVLRAATCSTATCPTGGAEPPLEAAGVVALSTYLPKREELNAAAAPAPIFLAHGAFDPLIPLEAAHRTRAALAGAGWPVEFHEYAMEHQVVEAEIRHLGAFLKRVLGNDLSSGPRVPAGAAASPA